MSDFSTTRKMSLMKILKSKGPNIEPWGIPRMTFAQSQMTLAQSLMSNALKKNDLKEKYDGRRNINCKKIKVYMWNGYCYYFDFPKIRVDLARTTKNQVAFA